jgi:hypothetical protein|tara:strand:+ start:472 stop:1485 length:1014 start_codon:yes stop_codon:yes gene_type:complete
MVVNFFKDFKNYIRLKILEKNFSRGFFVENNSLLKYLETYINYKKSLIISFESLKNTTIKKENIFIFSTNFFRQLVFLTLKLDYLYSTTPGLNQTSFQKTKFSKCKYIYLQHSSIGLIHAYNHDAFINFDVVHVINNFQVKDLITINSIYKKKIKIFKSKYSLFNKIFSSNNVELNILIAPSWNTSFYKNNYHNLLFRLLTKKNVNFSIRPHPMSFKKNEISKLELLSIGYKIDDNNDFDFKTYNTLISDWSGIFIEFSYYLKKKAFLINTPKKILNKNSKNFNHVSFEEFSRNEIANIYNDNCLDQMVEDITNDSNENIEKDKKVINKFFKSFFFN